MRAWHAPAVSIGEQKEYILAAHSIGEGHGRIMIRTYLSEYPVSRLLCRATMGLASAILAAAALGFLGLGRHPTRARVGRHAGR